MSIDPNVSMARAPSASRAAWSRTSAVSARQRRYAASTNPRVAVRSSTEASG
jgi:hypothetical protein